MPYLARPAHRGALMNDVIVFHHAQGLTGDVREFADQLRAAGHHLAVSDLYDAAMFNTIKEGVGHAEQVGFTATTRASRRCPQFAMSSRLFR